MSAKIHLYHMTAPGCAWSWGYEPVLQRLRLVYGDQVGIHLVVGSPYDDFDAWLREYGMTWDEAVRWLRDEIAPAIGIPMMQEITRETFPWNVTPASQALFAARRQGADAEERLARVLTRRINVESAEPSDAMLLDAAKEAGLDATRFAKDWADKEAVVAAYESQHVHGPHVPLTFYNLAVSDGAGRTVVLDHAFDPAVVEDAIGWLSGGKLRQRAPPSAEAYLRRVGPASALEVARVLGIAEDEARAQLEALAKRGAADVVLLAGAPHWTVRATARGAK